MLEKLITGLVALTNFIRSTTMTTTDAKVNENCSSCFNHLVSTLIFDRVRIVQVLFFLVKIKYKKKETDLYVELHSIKTDSIKL